MNELKQFGYADGDYMGRCSDCGCEHIADKRATVCVDCAYRKLADQQAEQIAELSDEVNRLRNNEKGRKPSCLINLDLRKENERLKKALKKETQHCLDLIKNKH